jgi:hypothetical protein
MKRFIPILIAAATAVGARAQTSPTISQPTPLGSTNPIVPSTFPKSSSTGPSFRPTPSKQLPSLRQASQGLNDVLDASRASGYGGLLGVSGVLPSQMPSSAAVQRLRTQQSTRSRQRLALNRSATSAATKHQVSHVLVPNLEVVAETPAAQPPAVIPVARTTDLQSRLKLSSIAVEMKGRTAVVTGAAPSELRRDLVTQVLLLEPGVDSVENKMTVAPAR